MARAIVWPSIAPPAETVPADAFHGLDLKGLAASFGPELARRMGLRVTAAADPAALPPVEPEIRLGKLPLAPAEGALVALHIGCTPQESALILERLFGAPHADPATAGSADLLALPPGSASWLALCRTVASALSAALSAAGRTVGGSPELPPRPLPLPAGCRLGLALDVDGTPCRLALVPEASEAAAPTRAAPDAAAFRRAARARVLDLELPVALRVAERRISLAQASALSAGDILPIDPLPMPELLAGGRRVARLPASAFDAARLAEDEQ